ncbi:MAG: hypothetical protein GY711_09595 [bacterium]|nr:hypothetical protein [bacterium]
MINPVIGALLSLAAATPAQDVVGDIDRLRDERRFVQALERSTAITDEATRHRARLNVYYFGGDLGSALDEATAGLAIAPDDAWLAYYGALLALDLGRSQLGAEYAARLAGLVTPEAGANLATETREFYEKKAVEFRARAAELEVASGRRGAAVGRARTVVLGAVAFALLALLLLSRSARDEAPTPKAAG